MPRSKEQNMEIRKQRSEAILRAALKVYVEKGYAASEIGDVAKKADIARGLVYYYFKDKVTLFRELFKYMINLSKEVAQLHFSKEEPLLDLLEQYVRALYRKYMEERESVLFFMRMSHDLKIIFTEEEMKDMNWPGGFLSIVSDSLKKGMDASVIRKMSPWLLTAQFWGTMLNAIFYYERKYGRGLNIEVKRNEIKEEMMAEVNDAVESCMRIVRIP